MRTKLIQIGNSKGILLPRTLIKQFDLKDQIIIEPTEKGLLISSAFHPREGWEDQFKVAIQKDLKNKIDLWNNVPNQFDEMPPIN